MLSVQTEIYAWTDWETECPEQSRPCRLLPLVNVLNECFKIEGCQAITVQLQNSATQMSTSEEKVCSQHVKSQNI